MAKSAKNTTASGAHATLSVREDEAPWSAEELAEVRTELEADAERLSAEVDEAEHDLRKLGLHLDTFNIHHVTDNVNYLQSLGRSVIAKVVREAEIAESDAQREAAQQEAKAQAEASVAQQRSEQAVTAKANEVRRTRAELEAAAR